MASGVMTPNILVMQSFWAVIASRVDVLVGATILILDMLEMVDVVGWWI